MYVSRRVDFAPGHRSGSDNRLRHCCCPIGEGHIEAGEYQIPGCARKRTILLLFSPARNAGRNYLKLSLAVWAVSLIDAARMDRYSRLVWPEPPGSTRFLIDQVFEIVVAVRSCSSEWVFQPCVPFLPFWISRATRSNCEHARCSNRSECGIAAPTGPASGTTSGRFWLTNGFRLSTWKTVPNHCVIGKTT